MERKLPDLIHELKFKTSRSSGAGGQNVNKVSTKVELIFHVEDSLLLSEEQQALISEKLATRIRNDGAIHVVAQTERTQSANKEKAIERFFQLIEKALTPVKKRKKHGISAEEKRKRLEAKIRQAQKKELRKRPEA
jgi:ribosome-associated protein